MSKHFITTGLSAVTLAAGLMIAAPASAQLGGLTGSVGGTLDGSVRSTTDISARTRTRTKVKARVNGPAVVTYGSTRSGGYHSHNHYGHHTHTHGYDHFYDNHSHGHAHGSHVYIHGEIKSGEKKKDEKQAEVIVVYAKADLLAYGTPLRTQSGASMGTITTLQRTQDGEIVGVTAGSTLNVIPVEELKVDGNVLVHTLPTKEVSAKTNIQFEAEVEMVK